MLQMHGLCMACAWPVHGLCMACDTITVATSTTLRWYVHSPIPLTYSPAVGRRVVFDLAVSKYLILTGLVFLPRVVNPKIPLSIRSAHENKVSSVTVGPSNSSGNGPT